MGTDKDWERWGATEPYFGVLSSARFRNARLDKGAREEFFATGNVHVDRVFQLINEIHQGTFRPGRALDFGCGVGRIILPLAGRSDRAVGVDISPSMIAEATNNAESAGISNVEFVLSDDGLTNVVGKFDLVHSYIVLQHIPWARGRLILHELANRVEAGGYLAVHLFAASKAPTLTRAVVRLRYVLPPLNWLRNAMRRRPLFEPAMQLHIYNIDAVVGDLKTRGFAMPVRHTEPDMDGFESVFLLARRVPSATTSPIQAEPVAIHQEHDA